jgi:integrase
MQFRDGLIMALLATRPIRRRNLVSIRIGEHLLREADGYWLRFRDVETKTRRNPLDMPFPAILVPFLDQYLTVYRPYLCTLILGERYFRQDPSNHLWVSVAHRPMSGDAIYDTITKWTAARLGCRLSPHRFRTCGATTIATEDPEHVHMIKDILGHATLRTAEDYYIVANSLKALHGHQARLQKLRNTPPDRARGPAKARAAQLLDAD